jgi:hypothetical protein
LFTFDLFAVSLTFAVLLFFSVVDAYQEWAGPVTPLVPNLRRLKNELGDDLLKFFVVS